MEFYLFQNRFGFHASEATSVDHLHLHCIAGRQTWVFSMAHFVPLSTLIEKLATWTGPGRPQYLDDVSSKDRVEGFGFKDSRL